MKSFARFLFVLVLAAAAVGAAFRLRRGVDTDLFSMLGARAAEWSDLNALSADAVRVLAVGTNRVAALRARYPFDPPVEPVVFLEKIRTHGKGLLAPEDRARLERGELDRIRRSVKRRDYSGMGLFPKADDPHYFLNDVVLALKKLSPSDLPDGATILTGSAKSLEAAVPGGLLALVREAEADPNVFLGGAPFHTAIARERTIREINILGAISLIAVLFLGWLLFRSFRFVPPMIAAIACGFLVATGAVCLLPGRPHALTFLFGTTLIGLGVDYCYHALSPERGKRDFVRSLTGALVTTAFAFAPLLFSSARVLRQMAVFSMAGLVAIYAFVLLFANGKSKKGNERIPVPALEPEGRKRGAPSRLLAVGIALVSLLALVFHFSSSTFRFSSDPSLFYKPADVMVRGEAKFASLSGGATGLRLVDFTAWQAENAQLKAKLGETPKGAFLTSADFPAGLAFTREGHDYLALPESSAAAIVGDAGEAVDFKAKLTRLFAGLTHEAAILAAVALVLLFLATLAVFGRRAGVIFVSPFAASLATAFTLAVLHEPLTFFHLLSFFVLIGLGIDYSIFQNSSLRPFDDSSRVVFFSFLTSLVGFGLLAFTSFPVTRGMGLTLVIGLFWAYVFARIAGRADSTSPSRNADGGPVEAALSRQPQADWHRQREQSAGRFRILVIWYLYRFLGKDVAKVLFFPAFLFIYPFCSAARAALAQYYAVLGVKGRPFRHLLSFAWSMIDKTDACTLRKNPPHFTLLGDTDWMKGGCFLLATHLGCVEVLPALVGPRRRAVPAATGESPESPRVHAFQQMGHDAVFTRIFAERLDANLFSLHAVEDIGVETAAEMQDAIRRGEIVLMAADRLAAATAGTENTERAPRSRASTHDFLGRPCAWPKGVFRFAKLMESPVYAIISVKTAWNGYSIVARRLGTDLLGEYVAFLEEYVRKYPYQWYQFYRFFDVRQGKGD